MHRWKVWYALRRTNNEYMETWEFFDGRSIGEALDEATKWLDALHASGKIVKSMILDMEIMGNPDVEMC